MPGQPGVLPLATLAVVFIAFLYLRSQELFVLSIRGGRAKLIRGRIPALLRADLAEAAAQMRVTECTITAVKTERGARLRVRGMNDFQAQRLRNIFRLYPMSDLRAARPPEHGWVVRWLGIAWLVWLFDRSVE